MSVRLSTRRQLELMQRLQQLADRRAERERLVARTLAEELAAADSEQADSAKRSHEEHASRRREIENQYAAARQSAHDDFERGVAETEAQFAATEKAARRGRDDAAAVARHQAQEAEWQALAVFEATQGRPQKIVDDAAKELKASELQSEGLLRDARTLLAARGLDAVAATMTPPNGDAAGNREAAAGASPRESLQRLLAEMRSAVLDMESHRLALALLDRGRAAIWIGVIVVVGTVAGLVASGAKPLGALGGALFGLAIGVAVLAVGAPRARRDALAGYRKIQECFAGCAALRRQVRQAAEAESQSVKQRITRERDVDVEAARRQCEESLAGFDAQLAEQLRSAAETRRVRGEELTQDRHRRGAETEAKFPPQLEQNALERQRDAQAIDQRAAARKAAAQSRHDADFAALQAEWLAGFAEVSGELAAMRSRCEELFPDWTKTDFARWPRSAERPEAIAFGRCAIPLSAVKNGLPRDERLHPGVDRLQLSATVPLEEQPRLILTADGEGRRAASEVLQLAMLRFLTAAPPGKVRLTIIDAAGLGDSFAAFMHLADYDEQLVSGRIWTDHKKIDERLSLLSDHMEKVLQKYLRNEFATIDDYNRTAGEVSEPYHLVVAANFPAGFTESAARKLVSIAANGPRCGVYVLASVDRQLRLPHEFRLDELVHGAVHLDWRDGRWTWNYPLFEKLALEIDPLPPADVLTGVLRVAGQQSKQASRVEVPFELAAPPADKIWTWDSSRELSAPIGRAGAKEMQPLRLGVGTSQHALISGKTGSGKSTLLHALITNMALHYGPDQLEFYLVDFKKGVEFKAYASGRLPHARVIAIESEREFGVSVLERLDQELRRRGELYREYGVQDLAGFRRAAPQIPMPRTLLVIDEFQELFVADDKLAADAALLLDRLVRQGRAFGIHVLLGSQTLSGAYSLARSTLGQMAIRIALECSEADSHIILSDENTAARLLSRPGEAIYNDQNGLVAGNHPFQVVWLPDPQRQAYLATLRDRAAELSVEQSPAIVFEGNVPALPGDNPELQAVLSAAPAEPVAEPTLWIGSAVRIEPPTRLVLRRQRGHNLAILGQQESMALGVLTAALAAVAAQRAGECRVTILDGTRPESEHRGLWSRFAAALGPVAERREPRDAAAAIVDISDEVARRNQTPGESAPPWYVVIHDVAQFRDLRQTEDDFGFSPSSAKSAAVDRRFRDVLREGPAVGVHVLLWCESYNTLTRSVDRLAMREIEFRIAMQMSATDSTSFIDSPAATLLGDHRALLYRDDLGTQAKFRPYGAPDDAWTGEVAAQLAARRPAPRSQPAAPSAT
jgi:energy-coupling factor transporter ATP-binding protein EcfA2